MKHSFMSEKRSTPVIKATKILVRKIPLCVRLSPMATELRTPSVLDFAELVKIPSKLARLSLILSGGKDHSCEERKVSMGDEDQSTEEDEHEKARPKRREASRWAKFSEFGGEST
jgi:hypothetical protein